MAQALINALIDTRHKQLDPTAMSGGGILMSSLKSGHQTSLSVPWNEAVDLIMGGNDGTHLGTPAMIV